MPERSEEKPNLQSIGFGRCWKLELSPTSLPGITDLGSEKTFLWGWTRHALSNLQVSYNSLIYACGRKGIGESWTVGVGSSEAYLLTLFP